MDTKLSRKSIDALIRLGDIKNPQGEYFSKVLNQLPADVCTELTARQLLTLSHNLTEEERQQKNFRYCRYGNLSLKGKQQYQILDYLGK